MHTVACAMSYAQMQYLVMMMTEIRFVSMVPHCSYPVYKIVIRLSYFYMKVMAGDIYRSVHK